MKTNLSGRRFFSQAFYCHVKFLPRIFLLLAMTLAGCGTWIGNPTQDDGEEPTSSAVDLSIQGSDDLTNLLAATIPVTDSEGKEIGSLYLDVAKIALAGISLKSAKGSQDVAGQFPGPYVVNLLTSEVTPEPTRIDVLSGNYGDIELQLHKLASKEASEASVASDDPIVGNSIYLEGTYTSSDSESKPFLFSYDGSLNVSLAEKNGKSKGARVAAGSSNLLIIAFRMTQWSNFSNREQNSDAVDFSQITDSSIVLDSKSSGKKASIRNVIRDLVLGSNRFGRDEDADGVLNQSEGGE